MIRSAFAALLALAAVSPAGASALSDYQAAVAPYVRIDMRAKTAATCGLISDAEFGAVVNALQYRMSFDPAVARAEARLTAADRARVNPDPAIPFPTTETCRALQRASLGF